jgi:fermentation-respiration switch protein FrsA (DUF1100 family)
MSTSVSIQASKVTFPNQLTSMAGSLFVTPNLDKTKKHPALAVAHPFGGVKEQTAGIYASKMAGKGYVTLAFDASHQAKVADIRGTLRTLRRRWRTSALLSTT